MLHINMLKRFKQISIIAYEREVERGEGGRKGRGGYTVKLKQMPVKEPPYVLVLIISTFVGTTTRLVLPLLVSSI